MMFYGSELIYKNCFNFCLSTTWITWTIQALKQYEVYKLKVLLLYAFALQSDLRLSWLLNDLNELQSTCFHFFWPYWVMVDFESLLNHKCDNIVLLEYLVKMTFVLCITTLYELLNMLRWYMHIWDCGGCYCAINNRALDCRTVKEEGPCRANVVERLAFKCA